MRTLTEDNWTLKMQPCRLRVDKLVQFAESALDLVGGRLFEGYAVGK